MVIFVPLLSLPSLLSGALVVLGTAAIQPDAFQRLLSGEVLDLYRSRKGG